MGFVIGLVFMVVAVKVFFVSHFDYDNIRRGTIALWSGINPWAEATRLKDFYNPPHSMLFLWLLIFLNQKAILVLGGACLFAFAFYRQAWVALTLFLTNVFLILVAAASIDMLVMGAGLLALVFSDRVQSRKAVSLTLRTLGYGLLLVKPQGGLFIVMLFVLLRRDWLGVLASMVVFGLPFLWLYPDWIGVLLTNPPGSQAATPFSITGGYGLLPAVIVAVLVFFSRRWKYWQLGGVLAGILSPYGMVGIPVFLALGAVRNLKAIPALALFSGFLAVRTWDAPESPLLGVYNLVLLGLALLLASLSESEPRDRDTVAISIRADALVRFLRGWRISISTPKRSGASQFATDGTDEPTGQRAGDTIHLPGVANPRGNQGLS